MIGQVIVAYWSGLMMSAMLVPIFVDYRKLTGWEWAGLALLWPLTLIVVILKAAHRGAKALWSL